MGDQKLLRTGYEGDEGEDVEDVLVLRMAWMEGLQFCLFLAWQHVSLGHFCQPFREGSPTTTFMDLLRVIFYLLFFALLGVLAFDIFIKPRLCPSSATASRTTSSVSNVNDNPLFGVGQMGAGL